MRLHIRRVFRKLILIGSIMLGIIMIAKFNNISSTNRETVFSSRQSTTKSTKWIVVTSINYPTEQIKKLAQIPGWNLLVVADKKTPKDWSFQHVTFLDIDSQLNLGYKVLEFIPWNSYTRKVIGYLYAIQHGAQFIYDTDDDNGPNEPSTFEQSFAFEQITRGLVLNSAKEMAINPYVHFGQPSVWPRGFPLELIGQPYNNSYTACQMVSPIIQQGIVNGDPDVDAIFRLTRKKFHSSINIQFDGTAPPFVLPPSVLTPFNSQNTIFHYEGFWAMILPISVSFRVTDIWRGYWAQPLLWLIGSHLGFYSANTTQIRNSHVYLRDFGEEDQLYKESGKLVQFLRNWKCSQQNLNDCILELSSMMAKRNFWSAEEVKFIQAWISDLESIGYISPQIKNKNSPCVDGKRKSLVKFNGIQKKALENFRVPLRRFCENSSLPTSLTTTLEMENSLNSALLIVTFNFPHYNNIWLLDILYRPHFPNILYCGHLENWTSLATLVEKPEFISANVKEFSFLHANVTYGEFHYECVLRAIDMNYRVKGYILVSDDVLFNFWNFAHLDPNSIWTFIVKPNNDSRWTRWKQKFGLKEMENAMNLIYNMENPFVTQYKSIRKSKGLDKLDRLRMVSDIFYIPKPSQEMFYEIGWIFRDCETFLEIAVPMIFSGITSMQDMTLFSGVYLWGDLAKSQPFKYFNASNGFLHPLKFSNLYGNLTLTNEFCSKYVSSVLSTPTQEIV